MVSCLHATHVGGATVHVFRSGSRNGDSGQACRGGYVYQTRWPRVAVGLPVTHVCVWYFPQILALPPSTVTGGIAKNSIPGRHDCMPNDQGKISESSRLSPLPLSVRADRGWPRYGNLSRYLIKISATKKKHLVTLTLNKRGAKIRGLEPTTGRFFHVCWSGYTNREARP